jgi:hypothetical protein
MYLSLNKLRSLRESSAFTARLPQRRLLTNPAAWLTHPVGQDLELHNGCVTPSQTALENNDSLLFIEKLDWERVKKLGGKFLQLRLEDLARRYQGT